MLRELAAVLRERWELRERARSRALSLHREAAILALSPIAFLLLIGSSAPGYLNAYRTLGGTLVSLAGAVVIGGCYLAMRRLGRIPEPRDGGRRERSHRRLRALQLRRADPGLAPLRPEDARR